MIAKLQALIVRRRALKRESPGIGTSHCTALSRPENQETITKVRADAAGDKTYETIGGCNP